jgi:homoserine dehydrogenase
MSPASSRLRLALVGFGHVGRRFATHLLGPYAPVLEECGVRPEVTGIATRRHGAALDPRGLDLRRCLDLVRAGRKLEPLHRGAPVSSVAEFIRRVEADVLLELTTLAPQSGEPATSYLRQAISRGLHAVTANKGPVAFALTRLRRLAHRHGVLFQHEGAVMDGTPVFNLVAQCLPGARVTGFRGVLNATTGLILSRMEQGATFAESLEEARRRGIVEADPSHDLDGWDAAVKGCVLANALMGASLRPSDVIRSGMRRLDPRRLRRLANQGSCVRLVVRGTQRAGHTRVSVRPEELGPGDPLRTSGADTVLILETDLMGEMGVFEAGATVDQTAYALLSDLVTIVRQRARRKQQARGGGS